MVEVEVSQKETIDALRLHFGLRQPGAGGAPAVEEEGPFPYLEDLRRTGATRVVADGAAAEEDELERGCR